MIQDVTHLLDREEGTAFDQENILFTSFDDGGIFAYEQAKVRDYKKMLDIYGKSRTLEQVLALPIRAAPWSLQRGRSPAEVHNFLDDYLHAPANNGGMSTPMNLVISQMCGAIVYRKTFFEKVFTLRNGKIVYDKLAWRPQSTCSVWRDKKSGAFKGFKQIPVRMEDTEEIKIPDQRAFVYIHATHRDPMEGASDLDIAYWCYITSQKIRFLWYSFLEGQALPKTVAKARDELTAQKAAKKIVGLRQGGVVGISDDVTLDTLESSGRGAAEFKAALQWLDSEASGSVLASFTDLGAAAVQGTGSFALSKDQTDFFLMSRQTAAREMADQLNQYVIPDLVKYNFGPDVIAPTFEFGPIAEDDAQQAIQLLQATAQSPTSVIPREFFDELIERVAGFLELDTQTVRKGLERAAKEAEERAANLPSTNPVAPEVARVAGAVDQATKAVVQKKVEGAGPIE